MELPDGDDSANPGNGDAIMTAFKAFDTDGNGTIARRELKAILQKLDGSRWTDEAADVLLEGADTDGDGGIQFTEFWRWVVSEDASRGVPMAEVVREYEERRALQRERRAKADAAMAARKALQEEKAKRAEEIAAGTRVTRQDFLKERQDVGLKRQVADEIFRNADEDGDGDITAEELKYSLQDMVASTHDIKGLFRKGCQPAEGALSQKNCDETAMQGIINTFSCWDENGDGVISRDELARVVRTLNPKMAQVAIDRMLDEIDRSQDGYVDVAEFVTWLVGGSLKKKKDKAMQKAKIACTMHRQRAVEAYELNLQDDWEQSQHKALEAYCAKKKIKMTCGTLNKAREECSNCEQFRPHVWFCHGCGFVSYSEECSTGCETRIHGWSCISNKCKGKSKCGCRYKPDYWRRKGFAMNAQEINLGVVRILAQRKAAEDEHKKLEAEGRDDEPIAAAAP
mmetsp:Transcript_38090/g.104843  ORF Transcript_38090/g.104843 Transcript_38090/m.104843 type:complete len:456 (+) Transcript_38090:87-1454(+)